MQKVSRDLWCCKWTVQENVFQVNEVDASRVCRRGISARARDAKGEAEEAAADEEGFN